MYAHALSHSLLLKYLSPGLNLCCPCDLDQRLRVCVIEFSDTLPAASLKPVSPTPPHPTGRDRTEQTRQLRLTCPRCAARPPCAAVTASEMSAGSEGMEGVRAKSYPEDICMQKFLSFVFY